MGHKQRLSLLKWISALGGAIGAIIGIISVDWGGVVQFGQASVFMYENAEELEHMVDDYHIVLGMQSEIERSHAQIDSLKRVLFETQNRDSLIHVIELLNRGKHPYDSIWLKGPSGVYYETTITRHYKVDHEN